MTEEDILVEFEADMAFSGEPLKSCPKCGTETHRKACPQCEIALTGDQKIDEAVLLAESGEDVDLDALLRPGKKEEMVPVNPWEVP